RLLSTRLTPLSSTPHFFSLFSFTDPAPPEISTLSLHDALPILCATTASTSIANIKAAPSHPIPVAVPYWTDCLVQLQQGKVAARSEEHTSELQSLTNLVCRLLLEKKKKKSLSAPHAHPASSLSA